TVIGVKEDEIVLNIGYKSDGIITRNEYTNTPNVDLRDEVKEGDTLEAKVLKVNDGDGQVLLSYKRLAADKTYRRLEEAFNNKEVLEAEVTSELKGGLSVLIDEVRVFIPASLISDHYVRNLEQYKGQTIKFIITEFNPRRRRIIGNRKILIEAEKEELKEVLFEKVQVGMRVKGTVKNIVNFGAFIDLGGADGLLHISEMSWGRVDDPHEICKVGEELEVLVKEISEERIALSLKFDDTNPWLNAEEKYSPGTIVTGKVARMTDFGAFVELEPGVDSLLHVSQISKEHVEKPEDVLAIGEKITAKVVDLDVESQKISLSIKAMDDIDVSDAEFEDEDIVEAAELDVEDQEQEESVE
ncbi:MAG: 30S ribosomal protein S1, partial [Clostridiales bacterium]|nr:30S ribosomal protein S1 [Clostridiales bacterium]